ncbi:PGAP1-like protein-domain-containing protein [Mycena metata]|uniref:GPI inositol-deacylase n=1 Tax=Mycena metata TaxID=1033252 RepID=A0AAD7HPZ3_9AGAR|nr:PGAP1-like protein-domain-containing protein [Mycena metata]
MRRPLVTGTGTRTVFLALFALCAVVYLYFATLDTARELSPQGCRMSYMWPSYVLQAEFDARWTPLAKRYSLWLYREVDGNGRGWEGTHVGNGVPVLFIPGNAGSSRQVRSIASSATRQYYDAPYTVALEFKARPEVKPLDFFAVEFNEDLSAFHGPTLDAQTAYTARAIAYIRALYPPRTPIVVMGHSMGGVVATALLALNQTAEMEMEMDIAAIITMSTPHTLPPARFDARIDALYERTARVLERDATPIVSLCGGATDMMIPSESCVLPNPSVVGESAPFRRTVFSSALEGAWTGVGHREMVWCHQVRWRLARAALELSTASTPSSRAVVLDRWLRDGHRLPPLLEGRLPEPLTNAANAETLPEEMHLVLKHPRGSRTYLLPVPVPVPVPAPSTPRSKFVLLVSHGSIAPVGPQKAGSLTAAVFACAGADDMECDSLKPTALKLIPSPITGRPFPIPEEGSDESEGIVLFEADVPSAKYIAVRMANAQGQGWITGGFVGAEPFVSSVSTIHLLLGHVSVPMPDFAALRTSFEFPNLLSNALVVYRLTPRHKISEEPCSDPLLAPLLVHTSHPSETHYFPLTVLPSHRILLHTHAAAPHVHSPFAPRGVRFTVYSSGSLGCKSDLVALDLSVDWPATLGRWASRYFTAVPSWAIGVVAIIIFQAWGASENNAPLPSVEESLALFTGKPLRRLLFFSVLLSAVPLPERFYLGNRGEWLFCAIAPLLLLVATGFVCVSWWVLQALIWPLGKIGRVGFRRRREDTSVHRSTVISMCLIFLLIFLFVPWQVAFLGCWAIHLYNCAASKVHVAHITSIPDAVAIPLLRRRGDDGEPLEDDEPEEVRRPAAPPPPHVVGNHNHNMHLLLLMTWLLPLAAPVLVVWARTLAVAGLTTPFDGDHFFLSVAPFLVLVDFASWTNGPLFERQSFERIVSIRWAFACLAAAAFLLGSRKAYFVFDAAKVAIGLVVLVRIGPRYWGRSSFSPAARN